MRRLLTIAALAVVATALAAPAAPAAHAADPCPNVQYRGGAGANLPDCRAWEQVTPVDKGGQQPDPAIGLFATASGDRLLSGAEGDLGGANGVAYATSFSSVRRSAWTTFGVDGRLDALTAGGFPALSRPTVAYSDDLTKALVVSLAKYTPAAVEGYSNLYIRDTADGSYTLAATVPGTKLYSSLADFNDYSFYGASRDFRHIAFFSRAPLVAGAPSGGNGNLYLLSDGRISLVGRGADDGPVSVTSNLSHPTIQRLVSDDGRRVTFVVDSAVYQRVDGASTVLVSRSRRSGDPPDAAAGIATPDDGLWASADGTEVTFGTFKGQFTDDGPPSSFYRWNAAGGGQGTLTNLLAGVSVPWSDGADNFRLRKVSPDGRYVWLTLTDPDPNGSSVSQLDLLDTQAKRITVMASSPDPPGSSSAGVYGDFGDDAARFSPDGTKLVLLSPRELTGYEQDCGSSGACNEAFLFDASRPGADPVCVSCGVPGTRSAGNAGLGQALTGRPRNTVITDAGQVLFSTPQPLVAGDANTLSDVYEYTPGRGSSLISSGSGAQNASVGALTPSGGDAFFYSADPLVPQDQDDALDVYDARVGGGIAAQQIAPTSIDPCPAANCRGPRTTVPPAAAPESTRAQPARRAPVFRVARVTAAARRLAASSGRLRLSVTVGAAGRLSGRAVARLGRRSSAVARGSDTVRKAGRVTFQLTLSRAARRQLARRRALTIRVSVSYSRASRAASQSVSLTSPRAARSSDGGAR